MSSGIRVTRYNKTIINQETGKEALIELENIDYDREFTIYRLTVFNIKNAVNLFSFLFGICSFLNFVSIFKIKNSVVDFDRNLKYLPITSLIHSTTFEIAFIYLWYSNTNIRIFDLKQGFSMTEPLTTISGIFAGVNFLELVLKISVFKVFLNTRNLEKIYDYNPLFVPLSLLISGVFSLLIILFGTNWIMILLFVNVVLHITENAYFDRKNINFNWSHLTTFIKFPIFAYFYLDYENVFLQNGLLNENFALTLVPLILGVVMLLNQFCNDGRFGREAEEQEKRRLEMESCHY